MLVMNCLHLMKSYMYIVTLFDNNSTIMGIYDSEFGVWLGIEKDIKEWDVKDNEGNVSLCNMTLSTYYHIYKFDINDNINLTPVSENGLTSGFTPSMNFKSYLDLIFGIRGLKIKHLLDN